MTIYHISFTISYYFLVNYPNFVLLLSYFLKIISPTVTDSSSSKTDCVYVFYYMYIETVKLGGFYVITKLNFFYV